MTWTLEYVSTLRIIELVFAGRTTGPDIKEATTKGIALTKEHGILEILIDITEMEWAASTTDVYDLPVNQYIAENFDRRSRLALVLSKLTKEKEVGLFYETVCTNYGWHVQSFPNRDEAIEWLTGTDSSNKPDAGDG